MCLFLNLAIGNICKQILFCFVCSHGTRTPQVAKCVIVKQEEEKKVKAAEPVIMRLRIKQQDVLLQGEMAPALHRAISN